MNATRNFKITSLIELIINIMKILPNYYYSLLRNKELK